MRCQDLSSPDETDLTELPGRFRLVSPVRARPQPLHARRIWMADRWMTPSDRDVVLSFVNPSLQRRQVLATRRPRFLKFDPGNMLLHWLGQKLLLLRQRPCCMFFCYMSPQVHAKILDEQVTQRLCEYKATSLFFALALCSILSEQASRSTNQIQLPSFSAMPTDFDPIAWTAVDRSV
jgi:hypothetical protein